MRPAASATKNRLASAPSHRMRCLVSRTGARTSSTDRLIPTISGSPLTVRKLAMRSLPSNGLRTRPETTAAGLRRSYRPSRADVQHRECPLKIIPAEREDGDADQLAFAIIYTAGERDAPAASDTA